MGSLKANVIIGKKDAAMLTDANKGTGFLQRAKVVVITDGAIGGVEGRYPGEGLILAASWHPETEGALLATQP